MGIKSKKKCLVEILNLLNKMSKYDCDKSGI